MKNKYVYDNKGIRFMKDGGRVRRAVVLVLKYFVVSLSLAVLYYAVFALVTSTDTERRLRQENRMFGKLYPEMEKKEQLLRDVVEGLQVKDDAIYEAVFGTSAPDMDFFSNVNFQYGNDTIPDSDIVNYASRKLSGIEAGAAEVEDNFMKIFASLSREDRVLPPMKSPLGEFSFAQVGASTGERISPFYKVKVEHTGLDIVSHTGEPVYATAPGTVSRVVKSTKGTGNLVEIEHEGGYVTRYAHLEDVAVPKGRVVRAGTIIGHVGMSGNSFAPHLHYEVLKDGVNMDPVHYFFGTVTPAEYTNMLVMAANTAQSLD